LNYNIVGSQVKTTSQEEKYPTLSNK